MTRFSLFRSVRSRAVPRATRRFCFLAAAALACAGQAAAARAEGTPVPVRLALQWLPQSQFAGFYMAAAKGYYRDAGLAVTLIHTGPGPSSLDWLAQGKADYCTLFLADALAANGKPVPLVNIAQFTQHSDLLLVAWKDMGIVRPADLDGRSVSYWQSAFSIAFTLFFRQQHVHPVIRPQHYSVRLFLRRGVTACAAMTYNEYHRIYQAGVDYDRLTVFRMSDFGLDFPEDGLYTRAETAQRQPHVCRQLRDATLAGWAYAREHPGEAVEAVLQESRNAGVPVNRPHTAWMLTHILESIYPAGETARPGRLTPDAFARTAQAIADEGLLSQTPAFETFAPFEMKQP